MSAIVLDGHLKSALAVVRSLGLKQVSVVCGAERKTAMACHSRYAEKSFVYTSPKRDQRRFIEEILLQAKMLIALDGKKPVLYSFSDATAFCLARAYDQLKEFVIMPMPSLESFEIAGDKQATYELAERLSLPTIRTFKNEAGNEILFPAVVKNRHSVVWKEGGAVSGSASFVFSSEELADTFSLIQIETGEAPLLQEFIKGDEYGIEMLCKEGEILLQFAHKRIRSLSPRGGAAVVKETAKQTQCVKLMQDYALTLVRTLSWTGPVMVEFKVDAQDGRVLLMEINGRFWGSLPLAVSAGVDFPMTYYNLAQGIKIERSSLFQPLQIRTRHFLGDVKWIMAVLFANDPLRKELYPSRLQAFWDFKKEVFLSKGDIFDFNDLKPSFYEYIDILSK